MSQRYPTFFLLRSALAARMLAVALTWATLALAPAGRGEEQAKPKEITNLVQLWLLSTSERAETHTLKVAGRVNYYDPEFKLFWLEQEGVSTYLLLAPHAPVMRTGQQVMITGTIVPNRGLEADRVKIEVVAENTAFTPLETAGRINDFTAFGGKIVRTVGYVDTQQLIDAQHVRMILIVENRPVICWIRPDDPQRVPDWRGRVVELTGLYSSRTDPTQTGATIELWLGRPDQVRIKGTLSDRPEFAQRVTPIGELIRRRAGTEVLIRGRLERQQAGTALVLRDATGQVEVRSVQQERLPPGSVVEAAGQVFPTGARVVVDPALYRVAVAPLEEMDAPVTPGALRSVAEIHALGQDEAALGRPVEVMGMVTWSLPDADFFYLQDLSGGTRVYHDRAKTGPISLGKYLRVMGRTRPGGYSPAIELTDFVDQGSMSHPPAKPVTLTQAMAGEADGDWVELQGFVRTIEAEGELCRINVTTPTGDFTGHLLSPLRFVANPGSLIRLHGVCETQVDAQGQVTGIVLRVPFLHDLAIEEEAPADYFDLPRHAVADLDRIGAGKEMRRVRVEGTVEQAEPGRSIYLLDGQTGLLLLSRDRGLLSPGDQIEAVGILGREGARTVLRESLFRKIASGPPPTPLVVDAAAPLVRAADGRLVRLRGTLIDVFARGGRTRLTLQQGSTLFDANLDRPEPLPVAVGAGLELTGIYQVVYDDSRQSRSFQLQLRNVDDVRVVEPARLWTVGRALGVAGVLGGCVLLGLAWIGALRRRVRQQTDQLREQMERQARLEAEVQRAMRLESLGALAGGIAHDYNNLLTVIMGNLALLKFNPLVMGTESERVRDIEQGAVRARDLTRQLLTFADGGEPLRQPCDLALLVRAAAARAFGGTTLHPDYVVPPLLPWALVDAEQLAQALQNLFLHTAQSATAGSEVRIALAAAKVDADVADLAPGDYVKVVIEDCSAGIAAEDLPRIFDPFFNPKRAGGGLGLATAYSIVKKHRGHLEAKSEVGVGTTFTLWLPVAPDTAPAAGTVANRADHGSPAVVDRRPMRVLLMDDEESIRRLGCMVLQRMGLESVAAADGHAALREFNSAQQAGRPFSLLILDLTVPTGLGGQATIEAIRATGSTVPAIVCSGYSRDPVMAEYARYGFQAVVTKPYEITQLMEIVRRLLPAGAAA